jgi:hypothetical protein
LIVLRHDCIAIRLGGQADSLPGRVEEAVHKQFGGQIFQRDEAALEDLAAN